MKWGQMKNSKTETRQEVEDMGRVVKLKVEFEKGENWDEGGEFMQAKKCIMEKYEFPPFFSRGSRR